MAFTTALYHPWIDLRNERWLKSACLYWSSIRTIVPRSMTEPYKTDISRRLAGEGILEPLYVDPSMKEVDSLAESVQNYIFSQEGAEVLLGRSSAQPELIHPDKLPRIARELAFLHPERLPTEIRRILQDFCAEKDGWLEVAPQFANFYMTLLAAKLAEENGFGLLASSFAADRLAGAARSGANLSNLKQSYSEDSIGVGRLPLAEGMTFDLIMEEISIDPDVPIEQLLSFRRQRQDELGRFRSKVGELAASAPHEGSLRAMRAHVKNLYVNEVRPAISDLKDTLRDSRIRTLTEGLLKISFLSAAPTSALVVAGLATPAALLLGAGLSLTAAATLYRVDRERILRENPYAYLLAVEQEFG